MKYEFHVGDYVETKDGDVGVVTKVNMLPCWYCTYGEGPRTKAQEYVMPIGPDEDMARVFKRIGKYEFTKVDRMEPLPDNNGPMYPNSLMWNKINELVMVVNELRAAQNGET